MPKPKTKAAPLAKKRKTLSTFKDALDDDIRHPAIVRAGLANLLASEGAEAYETEQEFLRRCPGCGNSNISRVRPLFAKHIVMARPDGKNEKKIWFATTAAAAKAVKIRGVRYWTPDTAE